MSDSEHGTAASSVARALLLDVGVNPVIVERLNDDQDLIDAGINSGELIKLATRVEELREEPLGADEVERLRTIGGIGDLVPEAAYGATPTPSSRE